MESEKTSAKTNEKKEWQKPTLIEMDINKETTLGGSSTTDGTASQYSGS